MHDPAEKVSRDQALAEFTEWFVKNYPGPTTIISDPNWHAPKVFRAAEFAMRALSAPPSVDERQRAIEALAVWDELLDCIKYDIVPGSELEGLFTKIDPMLRALSSAPKAG